MLHLVRGVVDAWALLTAALLYIVFLLWRGCLGCVAALALLSHGRRALDRNWQAATANALKLASAPFVFPQVAKIHGSPCHVVYTGGLPFSVSSD